MAEAQLAVCLNDFCVKLYWIYAVRDGNIFLSPHSISAALLLADLGAEGETNKQIRTTFGLESIPKLEVHKAYKQLESALNAEKGELISLSSANKIFSKSGLKVDERYVSLSKEYYGSGVEMLDFKNEAEKSRVRINKWVEDRTESKIQNLLPSGSIGPLSLLVLVNAIYFKGKWINPFQSFRTLKEHFYLTKRNTVPVDMMHDKQNLKYVRDKEVGYSAVELRYQGGNITMVFILLNEIEGLGDIEKKMDSGLITDISRMLKVAGRPEVILEIPKFKMETMYELERDLPKLGITDMFNQRAANFSAMFPETNVFISSAIHKAYIEVDEQGTEAAAATALVVTTLHEARFEQPNYFIANHPFIFLIREAKSDTILFMGRYIRPPT